MVEVASDSTDLISRVSEYVEETAQVDAIRAAYDFAAECHDGQKRLSGDPYIVHPLAAATILADLYLDPDTIKAALLHDVVEDCGVDVEDLETRFGPDVARLVDGVTKLERVDYRPPGSNGTSVAEAENLYAESLRKMLVAMAEDIRVVLIKLADRLHNMRTLDPLPVEKRRRIAQETLDVYSPLAHRLGIWELKWQLDDLAFRHLNESKYREISRMLAVRRSQREAYVADVSSRLGEELAINHLSAEVYGRPKGIYSIHKKMEKYAAEGKELSEIYDQYALRVIVEDVPDCYAALGITHRMWNPIPGQFDDYIATPKQNMYQALHTTVHCDAGHPLEVQIKTRDMHQVAEYGVAAHWRYKERTGSAAGGRFEERMTWLRQLLEWQRETPDTNEFLESVREDLFHDQVFVYTPKGDIMELAAGATPIDFAYKIHTDLGHRISGAKVNGRLMSLDTPLENGDTVEVVAGKTGRGPSPDWLNPARGYVATNSARQKIRSWFNRQARSANIVRGKDLLRRELHRMGVKLSDREVLELCRFETMEDLLAALGSGELSDSALAARLAEHRSKEAEAAAAWMPPLKGSSRLDSPTSGISVLGVGDLLTRIATCCNPIQGDAIIGFVTRSRGVSVHKVECKNVLNEDEKERLVPVSWGQKQELYPVRVRIEAIDRVGLLRDVSTKLSEDKINIAWVVTRENDNATVSMELTIHIAGLQQLNRVFSRIESVRGVTSVSRVTSSPLRQTER